MRTHRRFAAHAADEGGRTEALLHELRAALAALVAGRAAPVVPHPHEGPAVLEVLAEAEAPPGEAPYLLWLKLQLDPLIDDRLPGLFLGREAYRRRHGVVAYGALFSGLARAERLLHRAWSAAVDGYEGEARQALADAAAQVDRLVAAPSSAPGAEAVAPAQERDGTC
jgi:hypothetical protein